MTMKLRDAHWFASLSSLRLRPSSLVKSHSLRRTKSTMQRTMIQPHRIFTGAFIPPPPPTLERLSPLSVVPHDPSYWKESSDDERTLRASLRRMQSALRCVHKRKVLWPTEGSVYPTSPGEYLLALLDPVADLYNELHSDAVLTETPMVCVELDVDELCAVGFSISDEDRQKWRINLPVVIALGDDILDPSGNVTSPAAHALNLALDAVPTLEVIIVTNFQDIVVFFPSWLLHARYSFARVLTTIPALALQAVCAASIHSIGLFINMPTPEWAPDVDQNLILPIGPPQDPSQPLLADEEVFRTHCRFSDFDKVTLVRDPARALQFFRWHSFVRSNNCKLVVGPGDTVNANVATLTEILGDARPLYPFDWSDLPSDTATHFRDVQRPCPVEQAGIADAFYGSKSFQLKITDVIAKGTDHGFATVYRCQLSSSIDNNPVSMSPSLCLKLFDDRFLGLEHPGGDEGDLKDKPLHCWFDAVVPVEGIAVNEFRTYEKLRAVQGTVVPRCYGVHEFALPDQPRLLGILMEYISGDTLSSEVTCSLSSEQQISVIQSCRHAVRMLDLADINQNDWHAGQIMLYTNPETQVIHCVFIDFALTRMTWSINEPLMLSNYSGCLHVLKSRRTGIIFDRVLLRDYFGGPDDWDPVTILTSVNGEDVTLEADDPFTYISFKSI